MFLGFFSLHPHSLFGENFPWLVNSSLLDWNRIIGLESHESDLSHWFLEFVACLAKTYNLTLFWHSFDSISLEVRWLVKSYCGYNSKMKRTFFSKRKNVFVRCATKLANPAINLLWDEGCDFLTEWVSLVGASNMTGFQGFCFCWNREKGKSNMQVLPLKDKRHNVNKVYFHLSDAGKPAWLISQF